MNIIAIKTPIHCTESHKSNGQPLMIARFDREGIYFWCKLCRKEHFFSKITLNAAWDELERLNSLQQKEYVELA